MPKAPFSFDTRSRDFPVACQQDQLAACVLRTAVWCLVSACTFPNIVLLFIFLPGQVTLLYGRVSLQPSKDLLTSDSTSVSITIMNMSCKLLFSFSLVSGLDWKANPDSWILSTFMCTQHKICSFSLVGFDWLVDWLV